MILESWEPVGAWISFYVDRSKWGDGSGSGNHNERKSGWFLKSFKNIEERDGSISHSVLCELFVWRTILPICTCRKWQFVRHLIAAVVSQFGFEERSSYGGSALYKATNIYFSNFFFLLHILLVLHLRSIAYTLTFSRSQYSQRYGHYNISLYVHNFIFIPPNWGKSDVAGQDIGPPPLLNNTNHSHIPYGWCVMCFCHYRTEWDHLIASRPWGWYTMRYHLIMVKLFHIGPIDPPTPK